jgi:hypothetical protein
VVGLARREMEQRMRFDGVIDPVKMRLSRQSRAQGSGEGCGLNVVYFMYYVASEGRALIRKASEWGERHHLALGRRTGGAEKTWAGNWNAR